MNTIRNIQKGEKSSYFRGAFNQYGKYQWKIKYYGFISNEEIEASIDRFFGENFQYLFSNLGRTANTFIEGRSGGWLVIDEDLTDEELSKVDSFIEETMSRLPDFLYRFRCNILKDQWSRVVDLLTFKQYTRIHGTLKYTELAAGAKKVSKNKQVHAICDQILELATYLERETV